MKRQGFIFQEIFEKFNIVLAIYNSSKGKRKRRNVQRILGESDYYAQEIQKMLVNKTYVPSGYWEKEFGMGAIKRSGSFINRSIIQIRLFIGV